MIAASLERRLVARGSWCVVVALLGMPAAAAHPAIDEAIALYASAAYDEALAALDRVPAPELSGPDRDSADRFRMLCLIALGRTAEAEQVIAALLDRSPTFQLAEDASPRARRAFDQTRRRLLPDIARRHYQRGRALHAERRHAEAVEAFSLARALAADREISAAQPALADLAELASGFEELSRSAAAATPARGGVVDRPTAGAPVAVSARVAPRPAAPPMRPSDATYSASDTAVIAPVALRQPLRWLGRRPPEAPTLLGVVEVLIDKNGRVMDAEIRSSVSRYFDAVLLDSVRVWEFRPAIRNGLDVRYRKVLKVRSGGLPASD